MNQVAPAVSPPREAPPIAKRFGKLLIANRGEIACRIARTAKRMGLKTVGVYSMADRDALHVAVADEAICIGGNAASESYLDIEKIIAAARATGSGAIHPGYGFLSENPDLAEACAAAGLVFVGPSVGSMRAMASKSAARALMEKAGVPILPGYQGEAQDDAALAAAATRIGYPILLKPSAGGGGKGMRIVSAPSELAEALAGARSEARRSFGDEKLIIEKYVADARHIEVQVFGDTHGNAVSIFERDCTLQRRHQKVIEEAPTLALSDARRAALFNHARSAAKATQYVGAGTVEFIFDGRDCYFLEMNTRLQVEHGVTEMITGLDLVEWQLRVAFGEPLPHAQEEISASGHAIEARVYAEDADRDLLPSTGRIALWREPAAVENIRIDSGFRAGDEVSGHYDPLLAKVIVRGDDRSAALAKLDEALREFIVAGVATNIPLLRALARSKAVHADEIDTHFIERLLDTPDALPSPMAEDLAAACGAVLMREAAERSTGGAAHGSPWRRADGWTIAGMRRRRLAFHCRGNILEAFLVYAREGLKVEIAGDMLPLRVAARSDHAFDVLHGDRKERANYAWSGRRLVLSTARATFTLYWVDPFAFDAEAAAGAHGLTAPMSGTIVRLIAASGAQLERGAPVLVIESMKMEHVVRAPERGMLVALKCALGDVVQQGAELADFDADAGEAP